MKYIARSIAQLLLVGLLFILTPMFLIVDGPAWDLLLRIVIWFAIVCALVALSRKPK